VTVSMLQRQLNFAQRLLAINESSRSADMGISRTVQSVFVLTLCARAASAQVPARDMKELEPRVFVVDDDQAIRTRLANLLASVDYTVELFANAKEYLARVPHTGAACIVLEVHLPGLDGLALQRQLTAEGRNRADPLHYRARRYINGDRGDERGAVDFLPKPFRDDELLSAVARALARSGEVAASRARLAKLTREFEVFRLVVAGPVHKEIGAELGVTLLIAAWHKQLNVLTNYFA
jgi:FixJ family two-component response regulator